MITLSVIFNKKLYYVIFAGFGIILCFAAILFHCTSGFYAEFSQDPDLIKIRRFAQNVFIGGTAKNAFAELYLLISRRQHIYAARADKNKRGAEKLIPMYYFAIYYDSENNSGYG